MGFRGPIHLPHSYNQIYSFIYCLDTPHDPRDAERIDFALTEYPWRGGYSYVNIYQVLRNQVPARERPKVASISYNSPGWIDLALNPDVALQIAKALGIYMGSALGAAEAYKKLDKIFAALNKQRREAQNANIKLAQAEAREVAKLNEILASQLGFDSVKELNERTKDPEVTAKLLMVHHRRLRTVSEFVKSGKVELPKELRDDG